MFTHVHRQISVYMHIYFYMRNSTGVVFEGSEAIGTLQSGQLDQDFLTWMTHESFLLWGSSERDLWRNETFYTGNHS